MIGVKRSRLTPNAAPGMRRRKRNLKNFTIGVYTVNNNPLFPFERNRYYAGKMLTSADFVAEQNYLNDKRRFVNNLMFGSGIVCGCNVYSLDDLSVFVESGFAIDRLGREIVIDTSVVKKLSAIDGFERIDSNRLTLCLRYTEENVHPVYSVNKQSAETEYEYNRIREGYELFLADTEEVAGGFEMETEFLAKDILYEDEDYRIWVVLPATVCRARYVKLLIQVEKCSGSQKAFSFSGCLQAPAFLAADGVHELQVEFSGLNLPQGEKVSQEYWLFVQDSGVAETNLMYKPGSGWVRSGDEEKELSAGFSMKVLVSDISPRELVDRELGKMSLELRDMGDVQDFICLADITLVRTDSAYIIENISERNVKKYIEAPAQDFGRSGFLDFFRGREPVAGKKEPSQEGGRRSLVVQQENSRVQMTTGTFEIPVGNRARSGQVFYSGEVMHGLGPGNVYVEIGQEQMEEDRVAGANTKSVIYGNAALFAREGGKQPEVETAVKVLNDKGSFVAAVRFGRDADCLMLTYRYVAIRFAAPGGMDEENEGVNQRLEAETPTVVLGAKESYYFGVRFHGMDKCSIGYELTEAGSGEITIDGVYTAPNKEGVYEIRIYCTDKPFICTYAYAIVKKK